MGSVDSVSGVGSVASLLKTNEKSEKKPASLAEFEAASDAVVIDASLGTSVSEANKGKAKGDNFQALYESLSLTAKEIVDKINEQLKVALPNGVQSLTPEEVTPEATAERIVSGVTAFFDTYAKRNKNLEGEELISKFLSEVKRGVDQGYGDAFSFLKGIGAFEVEGVQSGIEKTRSLIDEKFAAFEAQKRKELGLVKDEPADDEQNPAAPAGSTLNAVA